MAEEAISRAVQSGFIVRRVPLGFRSAGSNDLIEEKNKNNSADEAGATRAKEMILSVNATVSASQSPMLALAKRIAGIRDQQPDTQKFAEGGGDNQGNTRLSLCLTRVGQ